MTGRSTPRTNKKNPRLQPAAAAAGPVISFQVFLLVLLIVSATVTGVYAGTPIDVSELSKAAAGDRLPAHWHYLNFPTITDKTEYTVVIDNEYGPVIRAQCSSAAGGIVRKMSADPQELPFIKWNWKVEDALAESSVSRREGDDFPARLMIIFKRRGAKSKSSDDNILCYVWNPEEPLNTFAPNPHLKNVISVVASGAQEQTGSWLEISRNIVEDYRQAFSEDPGLITGVALMTDCDDTESSALAWYGPIRLSVEDNAGD